jgi:hypothetical protein
MIPPKIWLHINFLGLKNKNFTGELCRKELKHLKKEKKDNNNVGMKPLNKDRH